ncbi:hypothetical protein SKAU_G00328120 [Synaphobranchus kaupii]|uniref:Uncharacterized protein n=1 Tax=Synaphobranchus kaupii TaxID=118154 RepID=A0A9Q1IKK9_SYNKA|nr:hypothetical protein SKAU_G00328120 [Synaphobranchus kaupii]
MTAYPAGGIAEDLPSFRASSSFYNPTDLLVSVPEYEILKREGKGGQRRAVPVAATFDLCAVKNFLPPVAGKCRLMFSSQVVRRVQRNDASPRERLFPSLCISCCPPIGRDRDQDTTALSVYRRRDSTDIPPEWRSLGKDKREFPSASLCRYTERSERLKSGKLSWLSMSRTIIKGQSFHMNQRGYKHPRP